MYKPYNDCQIPMLADIYMQHFGYKTNGTFVEVGAYDGESISNTVFLADIGWEGVYVEPIPEHARQAEIRHAGNDVKVFTVAAGDDEGIVEIMVSDALSSS